MTKNYNIIDVIKDAITGNLEFADQETIDNRRSICNGCEARNHTLDVCTACGCVISAKIRLKESQCPMELW